MRRTKVSGSRADLLVPLAQRVDRDHPFPVCRRAWRERGLARRGRTRVTCRIREKKYGYRTPPVYSLRVSMPCGRGPSGPAVEGAAVLSARACPLHPVGRVWPSSHGQPFPTLRRGAPSHLRCVYGSVRPRTCTVSNGNPVARGRAPALSECMPQDMFLHDEKIQSSS